MSESLRRSARESKKPEVFSSSIYKSTDTAKRGGGGGGGGGAGKAGTSMVVGSDDDVIDDDDDDDVTAGSSDESEGDMDFDDGDRVVFAHKMPKNLAKRGGSGGSTAPKKNVPNKGGINSVPNKNSDASERFSNKDAKEPRALESLKSTAIGRGGGGGGGGGSSMVMAREEVETTSEMFDAVQSTSGDVDFISITNDWIR